MLDAPVAKGRIVPLADGHINVAVMKIAALITKIRGNHAHHGVAHSVERQGFSERVRRRGEFPFPESAADERHRLCAHLVLLGAKQAARHGVHAQHGEEIRGDHFRFHALGLAHARQVVIVLAKGRHRGERALVAHPVEKIGIGDGRVRKLFGLGIDGDQAIRLPVGERIEQHAIHHGKQRGIRADAERQRENRNRRKARRFGYHAEAVTNILQKGIHVASERAFNCDGDAPCAACVAVAPQQIKIRGWWGDCSNDS